MYDCEPGEPLRRREVEILRVLASGVTLQAAGDRLGLSYQTIKNYTSSAYHKLGVGGLVEAFAKLGWLVPR